MFHSSGDVVAFFCCHRDAFNPLSTELARVEEDHLRENGGREATEEIFSESFWGWDVGERVGGEVVATVATAWKRGINFGAMVIMILGKGEIL